MSMTASGARLGREPDQATRGGMTAGLGVWPLVRRQAWRVLRRGGVDYAPCLPRGASPTTTAELSDPRAAISPCRHQRSAGAGQLVSIKTRRPEQTSSSDWDGGRRGRPRRPGRSELQVVGADHEGNTSPGATGSQSTAVEYRRFLTGMPCADAPPYSSSCDSPVATRTSAESGAPGWRGRGQRASIPTPRAACTRSWRARGAAASSPGRRITSGRSVGPTRTASGATPTKPTTE